MPISEQHFYASLPEVASLNNFFELFENEGLKCKTVWLKTSQLISLILFKEFLKIAQVMYYVNTKLSSEKTSLITAFLFRCHIYLANAVWFKIHVWLYFWAKLSV